MEMSIHLTCHYCFNGPLYSSHGQNRKIKHTGYSPHYLILFRNLARDTYHLWSTSQKTYKVQKIHQTSTLVPPKYQHSLHLNNQLTMMFSFIIVASITLSGVVLGRPEYLTEHAPALTCDNFNNNTVLPTWAGVMLEPPPADQHFITAVGTFSIPNISGSNGDVASAWVGIGSPGTIFQAGVNLEMRNGEPLYTAWTEWFPDHSHPIPDLTISAGDSIKVTIKTTSATEGTATIDNLTTAKSITVPASAPSSVRFSYIPCIRGGILIHQAEHPPGLQCGVDS